MNQDFTFGSKGEEEQQVFMQARKLKNGKSWNRGGGLGRTVQSGKVTHIVYMLRNVCSRQARLEENDKGSRMQGAIDETATIVETRKMINERRLHQFAGVAISERVDEAASQPAPLMIYVPLTAEEGVADMIQGVVVLEAMALSHAPHSLK